MTELLNSYINGNHIVSIYDDGTKVSKTVLESSKYLTYDFPESFDFKLTNKCSSGCKFCHESSTKDAENKPIKEFLDSILYDSIRPFTEMAIGGGNIFEDENDLNFLLETNKAKNIVSNITISQTQSLFNYEKIKDFISRNLIKGLGISINPKHGKVPNFGDNTVLHVINGIMDESWIPLIENQKILILGFKNIGRGIQYLSDNSLSISEKQQWMVKNLKRLSGICQSISFDCLAVKQLDPQKVLDISCNNWNLWYNGDDETKPDELGNLKASSMFIDWPNLQISRSSTSFKRIPLNLQETIDKNFRRTFQCPSK